MISRTTIFWRLRQHGCTHTIPELHQGPPERIDRLQQVTDLIVIKATEKTHDCPQALKRPFATSVSALAKASVGMSKSYFPQVAHGISAYFFLYCLRSVRAHSEVSASIRRSVSLSQARIS